MEKEPKKEGEQDLGPGAKAYEELVRDGASREEYDAAKANVHEILEAAGPVPELKFTAEEQAALDKARKDKDVIRELEILGKADRRDRDEREKKAS